MKKGLLFLLAVSSALGLAAQPTITGAGCNPVAGETFYGFDCSTVGVTMGAAGAGVTWNFASLNTPELDTLSYIACAGTPYCDTFPGSTLASVDDEDEYTYFVTDAAKFAITGFGMSGGSQYYSNLQNYMVYPMSYNTVKVDSYVSSQPAFQTYSYGVDSFYADAYGTLILPTGTYNNVLRVHLVLYGTDSFDFATPAMVDHRKNDIYFWYKEGFHNPLLIMYYDSSGTGISHVEDVEYYLYTPAGVNDIKDNKLSAQVYPNPANTDVHVKLNLKNSGQLSISATDMMGRDIAAPQEQYVQSGSADILYDVSALPAGLYILKIQTAEGTELKKIQITR